MFGCLFVFWLWKSQWRIMDYKYWENNENSWRIRERVCSKAHLEGQPREEAEIFPPGNGTRKERFGS